MKRSVYPLLCLIFVIFTSADNWRVQLTEEKVYVFFGDLRLNNGANVTDGNIQSIWNNNLEWFKTPVNITMDSPLLDSNFVEFLNLTYPVPLFIEQIHDLVFRATLIKDGASVVYFGGPTDIKFICEKSPRVTRSPVECHECLPAGQLGSVILSFDQLENDVDGKIDSITFSSTSSNGSIILEHAFPIAFYRLDEIMNIQEAVNQTLNPANNYRRDYSNTPVGFAVFFIVLIFLSGWTISAINFAWLVPIFFGRKLPTSKNFWKDFWIWMAIIHIIGIIVTFAARFPGWVIFGIILIPFNIVVIIWYFVETCKGRTKSDGIPMSSSQKELNDPDQELWWSGRPYRHSKYQIITLSVLYSFMIISIFSIGICWAAWKTSEYYVWERDSFTPIVEIQPAAVTKSTLALYTFDGLSLAVDINFFLQIFTETCRDYYTQNLTLAEKKDKILDNYIDLYQIDMTQFTPSDYTLYPNVNEFFIRHILPDSRPIASLNDPSIFVSPADARLLYLPNLPTDFEIVIKEEHYTLGNILASEEHAELFVGGSMMIVRLAPQDYHRYHAPIDGTVISKVYAKGTIFSVNADAVRSNNAVFLNQRAINIVQTSNFGTIAYVSVGATCVGSVVDHFEQGSVWQKGEMIGQFEYGGSTVLLLFQKDKFIVDDDLAYFSQLEVEDKDPMDVSSRSCPVYQVDAFTTKSFTGNAACVCLMREEVDAKTMQGIAFEMNLSETAFVTPLLKDQDFSNATQFNLRWFTPKVEVPLCGHATLAAAYIIFRLQPVDVKVLEFMTLSGTLKAERDGDFCSIFLPTTETIPFKDSKIEIPRLDEILKEVLGNSTIQELLYVPARKRILVRLDDERGQEELHNLDPKTETLLSLHDGGLISSVTVTSKSTNTEYDFYSRHFSPWIGIPEDPVTGSAHSYIATYWAKVLQKKQFFARQCSKRGGDLKITLLENEMMRVEGKCVIIFEGKLYY